jgi:thioredoxin-related protein
MKTLLSAIIILLVAFTGMAQKTPVKWYTLPEAEKLIKENPRPVFIDTYTDWCGWCKKLDKETFTNSVIAEILNTEFYPVKFNAEGTESVTFQGKTFINDGKSGKTHQLAISLLKGNLGYPTVVFLDEKGQLLTPVAGFRAPKEMEVLLSYFVDKEYEKKTWEEFQKTFKGRVE